MSLPMYKKIIDRKEKDKSTLEQVASEIGVSLATVKKWKYQDTLVSNIIATARYLQTTVDALLELDFIDQENAGNMHKAALLRKLKNLDLSEEQYRQLLRILHDMADGITDGSME